MKVRIIIGQYAYACITHEAGTTDIRLEPGRSAPVSLREYAGNKRRDAERALELAELAEQAATVLEVGQ